jgi:hypothetical protein
LVRLFARVAIVTLCASLPPAPARADTCSTKPNITNRGVLIPGAEFTLSGKGQGSVTTAPIPPVSAPSRGESRAGPTEVEGNVYGLNLDLDLPGYVGGGTFQSIPGPTGPSEFISGGMHVFIAHFVGSYQATGPFTCQAGSVFVNYYQYSVTGMVVFGQPMPYATGGGIIVEPCSRPICQTPG